MAEHQHSAIFSDSECLSMDLMERYASDQISDAERQVVEKHLVDCDLCSDALEGLTLAGFSPDISNRITSLNERIANETQESRGGFWKREYMPYAAAMVGLMLISGILLNLLKTSDITNTEFISEDIILEAPAEEHTTPSSGEENKMTEKTVTNKDASESNLVPIDDLTEMSGALKEEPDIVISDDAQPKLKLSAMPNSDKWSSNKNRNIESPSENIREQVLARTTSNTLQADNGLMATGESEDEDARRYSVDEEYRSENKQENGVQLGGSFDQSGFAKEGLPKSTSEYDVGLGDDRPTSATPEQEMVILADESLEESELSKREIIEAEQTFKRSDKTRLNEPSGKKEAAAKAMTRDEETTTLKATDRVRSESSKNDYKGTKTKSKRQQAPSYASSSKKKRRTTSKGVSSSANMNEKDKKKEEPNDDSNTFGSTVVGNHIEADIESAVSDTVEAEITVTSPAVAQPTGTIGGLDTDEVAGEADQDPMFLGGEQNLKMYLQDNVVYPEAAENLGIQCKVNVTFTVNADSTISDANIVQPVGGGCDEEALRVVNNMPNWIPAQQKGKKVARKYNLEIDFESIKK